MKKFNEIRSVLQHVFSANRRKKVSLLVREWVMGLPQLVKGEGTSDRIYSADPAPNTWTHRESRAIDPAYLKRETVAVVEDHLLDDGLIHVEHEYSVHKLHGGYAYTNELTHRSIFSQSGERVELLSCTGSGARARAPSKLRIPNSKTVPGVTANLYGTIASAEGNYLHWFADAMSRLFLIERFHSLDSIDQILVPPLKYDFHWDTVAAFGFDRSQVIEHRPLECLQFECLLASSWPRGRGSAIFPGWAIDRYQQTLLDTAKDITSVAGKKVYVSRRDAPTRMFSNELEVCDFLESRGFDIVELTPLNLANKIAVFRDADVIVSQTGAGLTNLMFSKPDVRVLELVDEKFVYPLYASLAVAGGGTHQAHFFSNDTALGRTNAMVAKSSMDINELGKAVDLLEA